MAGFRRFGLIGAFIFSFVPVGVMPSSARGEPHPQFSSMAIDVLPLRAQGLEGEAEVIRSALWAELYRRLSGHFGSAGPVLIVRVTAVSLRHMDAFGTGAGTAKNDYLQGEILMLGKRYQVLARFPHVSVLPASYGHAWYGPGPEQRRILALSEHFAASAYAQAIRPRSPTQLRAPVMPQLLPSKEPLVRLGSHVKPSVKTWSKPSQDTTLFSGEAR